MRSLLIGLMVIATALLAPTHAVLAQAFPSKVVRLIIPFPVGSSTDAQARIIGPPLSERWKQQVIADSRPGATTIIGTDLVAKSPPDGHTLLFTSIQYSYLPALFAKLPYDPYTDLVPITIVAFSPEAIVAHPSLPVKNVREFIALIKARPGQFNYASAGPGSPQHLTAEMFKFMTKVEMTHIPYKGSGPAIVDLIGGQIPFAFESMIPVLPHVKGGKLRGLAVTSATRSPVLPEIATVAEGGVPGFESIAWYGVVAPAGTPKEIVAKLNGEMVRIANMPDIKQRLIEMGSPPVAGTPDQFGALIKSEIPKWAKVVKQANVSLD